jgi:hypothetical protein
MTTALERGVGSASRPGCSLPPGKTRYSLHSSLGRPQGRSGQVWKISHPPGFDPRTVQPVAGRYTQYATRSTVLYLSAYIIVQLKAHLQDCEKRLLPLSCLSFRFARMKGLCSHWTNFMEFNISVFLENCRENSRCMKIWQERRVLYMKINIHL